VEIKESFSFSSVHNGGSFIGFNNTMKIKLYVIMKFLPVGENTSTTQTLTMLQSKLSLILKFYLPPLKIT
jgi:hypothetical protein